MPIGFVESLLWLSLNVYHESRGEPEIGQLAVAHVTLNRALEDNKSVADVILAPNQFSWTFQKKEVCPARNQPSPGEPARRPQGHDHPRFHQRFHLLSSCGCRPEMDERANRLLAGTVHINFTATTIRPYQLPHFKATASHHFPLVFPFHLVQELTNSAISFIEQPSLGVHLAERKPSNPMNLIRLIPAKGSGQDNDYPDFIPVFRPLSRLPFPEGQAAFFYFGGTAWNCS